MNCIKSERGSERGSQVLGPVASPALLHFLQEGEVRKEDLFPDMATPDPSHRIRASITRIRGLRSQAGHDGPTPSASRTLIDELTSALEEVARALDDRAS